ncbi:pyruvate dehydrogenase subunit E1 [Perkinsela sp. CCAP 1560/4]|nr:pyruvate dehydrogenase subunit E1 [Perkinsela sp. CCAP 1560/4]|eukprot:KNH09535.1 pyruvate dehydrogenase subunit E1 [Perkinsela sp. CCAP 1560/4]
MLHRVRAFCMALHTTRGTLIKAKLFNYQAEAHTFENSSHPSSPPPVYQALAFPFVLRQKALDSHSIVKCSERGTGSSETSFLSISKTEAMNFELYSSSQAFHTDQTPKVYHGVTFCSELAKHLRNYALSGTIVWLVDKLFQGFRPGWEDKLLDLKESYRVSSSNAIKSTMTFQNIIVFRLLPSYPEILHPFHRAHRIFQQTLVDRKESPSKCYLKALVPETPYYFKRLSQQQQLHNSEHCPLQKMHYMLESYIGIFCANPSIGLISKQEAKSPIRPDLCSVFVKLFDIFIVRVRASSSSKVYRYEILHTLSNNFQRGTCHKKEEVTRCILKKIQEIAGKMNALIILTQKVWHELIVHRSVDSSSLYLLLCVLEKSDSVHFLRSKALSTDNTGVTLTTMHSSLADAWRILKKLYGEESLLEECLIANAVKHAGQQVLFQEPLITWISSYPWPYTKITKKTSFVSPACMQRDFPAVDVWCKMLVRMNVNWGNRESAHECKSLTVGPDAFPAPLLVPVPRVSYWDYLEYSARRRSVLQESVYHPYARRIAVCLPVPSDTGTETYLIAEICPKPSSSNDKSTYKAKTILTNEYFWKNSYCCENPQAFYEANCLYADQIVIGSTKRITQVDTLKAFDVLVFHRFGLPFTDADNVLKASQIPNAFFLEFIKSGGRIWCTLFGSQLLSGHISSLPSQHELALRESTGIYKSFQDSSSLDYFILALAQVYNHQLLSALISGTLPSIINQMKSLYISHISNRTGIGIQKIGREEKTGLYVPNRKFGIQTSNYKKFIRFCVRREANMISYLALRHIKRFQATILKDHSGDILDSNNITRLPKRIFAFILRRVDWSDPKNALMLLNGSSAEIILSDDDKEKIVEMLKKMNADRQLFEDRLRNQQRKVLSSLLTLAVLTGCADPVDGNTQLITWDQSLKCPPPLLQPFCQMVISHQNEMSPGETSCMQLDFTRNAPRDKTVRGTETLDEPIRFSMRLPCKIFILTSDALLDENPGSKSFSCQASDPKTRPEFVLYDIFENSFSYLNDDDGVSISKSMKSVGDKNSDAALKNYSFEIPVKVHGPASIRGKWNKVANALRQGLSSSDVDSVFGHRPFILILAENGLLMESVIHCKFPKAFGHQRDSVLFADLNPLLRSRNSGLNVNGSNESPMVQLESECYPYVDGWQNNMNDFPNVEERRKALRQRCLERWNYITQHCPVDTKTRQPWKWIEIPVGQILSDQKFRKLQTFAILLELGANAWLESKRCTEVISCEPDSQSNTANTQMTRLPMIISSPRPYVPIMKRTKAIQQENKQNTAFFGTDHQPSQSGDRTNPMSLLVSPGSIIRVKPSRGYVNAIAKGKKIFPSVDSHLYFTLLTATDRLCSSFEANVRQIIRKLEIRHIDVAGYLHSYQKYFASYQNLVQIAHAETLRSDCDNSPLFIHENISRPTVPYRYDPYDLQMKYTLPLPCENHISRGIFQSRYASTEGTNDIDGYLLEVRFNGKSFHSFCEHIVASSIVSIRKNSDPSEDRTFQRRNLQDAIESDIKAEFTQQIYRYNPFVQGLERENRGDEDGFVGQIRVPPLGTTVSFVSQRFKTDGKIAPGNTDRAKARSLKNFFFPHDEVRRGLCHSYREIFTVIVDNILQYVFAEYNLEIETSTGVNCSKPSNIGNWGSQNEKHWPTGKKMSLCTVHCPWQADITEDYLMIFDIQKRESVDDLCRYIEKMKDNFRPLLREIHGVLFCHQDRPCEHQELYVFPKYGVKYGRTLRAMEKVDL